MHSAFLPRPTLHAHSQLSTLPLAASNPRGARAAARAFVYTLAGDYEKNSTVYFEFSKIVYPKCGADLFITGCKRACLLMYLWELLFSLFISLPGTKYFFSQIFLANKDCSHGKAERDSHSSSCGAAIYIRDNKSNLYSLKSEAGARNLEIVAPRKILYTFYVSIF